MKTLDLFPEQTELLTTKLLRVAQVKKIDTIKMHRQALMDVLNGEGDTRTVRETGKNLTKSGISVTRVETHRSLAHNIQAVRLDRQLQQDWDKLVVELTPQPDLLARLLYHQGAEREPDYYSEKVDLFLDVLLEDKYEVAKKPSAAMVDTDPPSLIATQSDKPTARENCAIPHSPIPAPGDSVMRSRTNLLLDQEEYPQGEVVDLAQEKNNATHSPLPVTNRDHPAKAAQPGTISGTGHMTGANNMAFAKYPQKNRTQPDLSGSSDAEDTNCQWDRDADETLKRIYNRKDDD